MYTQVYLIILLRFDKGLRGFAMKLKNILTSEQEEAGLTLHDDEDMIYLLIGEKILAAWSSRNANCTIIRAETQNILAELRHPQLTCAGQ
jgi:hypothetical protein